MARKVLYLLTKPHMDPLLRLAPSEQETSVVLLQDGASLKNIPGKHVYVLEEENETVISSSPYEKISYRGLVNLIMDSDHVVGL